MAEMHAARDNLTLEQIAHRTGLRTTLLCEIRDIAIRCGLTRLVLYGSRARGSYNIASDIDLACRGGKTACFALDVDSDTSTALKFDIVDLSGPLSREFRSRVEKEGIAIPLQKYQNYKSNLLALEEAVSALARHANPEDPDHSVVLSGIVHKFAMQVELGWKTLAELLKNVDGVSSDLLRTPRSVIKEAYAAYPKRFDGDLWLEMLTRRNSITHIYDEGLVTELVDRIIEHYLPVLQELKQLLLDVYGPETLSADTQEAAQQT